MKRVYIAGKLNDDACGYVKNMHVMITEAKKVRDLGYSVYVPCVDFLEGLVSGNFDYTDYFDNSQPFLKVCHVVYVCPNWETSEGTKREIETAKMYNIPVCYSLEELKNALHS